MQEYFCNFKNLSGLFINLPDPRGIFEVFPILIMAIHMIVGTIEIVI